MSEEVRFWLSHYGGIEDRQQELKQELEERGKIIGRQDCSAADLDRFHETARKKAFMDNMKHCLDTALFFVCEEDKKIIRQKFIDKLSDERICRENNLDAWELPGRIEKAIQKLDTHYSFEESRFHSIHLD